jgi:hypothetical protein
LVARRSDGLGGSSGSGERCSRFVPCGPCPGCGRVGVASQASGRENMLLMPENKPSEPERRRFDMDCEVRSPCWGKAEGGAPLPLPSRV